MLSRLRAEFPANDFSCTTCGRPSSVDVRPASTTTVRPHRPAIDPPLPPFFSSCAAPRVYPPFFAADTDDIRPRSDTAIAPTAVNTTATAGHTDYGFYIRIIICECWNLRSFKGVLAACLQVNGSFRFTFFAFLRFFHFRFTKACL